MKPESKSRFPENRLLPILAGPELLRGCERGTLLHGTELGEAPRTGRGHRPGGTVLFRRCFQTLLNFPPLTSATELYLREPLIKDSFNLVNRDRQIGNESLVCHPYPVRSLVVFNPPKPEHISNLLRILTPDPLTPACKIRSGFKSVFCSMR